MYLRPFLIEQRLEHIDELQVGGGRDVVVPLEPQQELPRELLRVHVEHLAQLDGRVALQVRQLHVL